MFPPLYHNAAEGYVPNEGQGVDKETSMMKLDSLDKIHEIR